MIGIIPAAGQAERFWGLPKFALPCDETYTLLGRLYALMYVHIHNIHLRVVTRNEHRDLVRLIIGDGVSISAVNTNTMTETVIKTFLPGERYVFGMPDTFFHDGLAFSKVAAALDDGADLAVGVFHARARQYAQGGMCSVDGDRIIDVIDKPSQQPTGYGWIWGVMAWKPAFWDFLKPDMPHVGYGIMPAIHAGLDVRAVKMDGGFWDCGTPERYFEMICMTTGQAIHV